MLRIMEILGNLISDHDFYHVQYRIMNIKKHISTSAKRSERYIISMYKEFDDEKQDNH